MAEEANDEDGAEQMDEIEAKQLAPLARQVNLSLFLVIRNCSVVISKVGWMKDANSFWKCCKITADGPINPSFRCTLLTTKTKNSPGLHQYGRTITFNQISNSLFPPREKLIFSPRQVVKN